ncbi:MAG: ABC transporter substrate-binding protein [Desulfovibrio sp.]|jgi:polar amino acid transport system substrate-binding protein|nr:ABC transporter substrate-binding protein [Desulfovibrio sp.]
MHRIATFLLSVSLLLATALVAAFPAPAAERKYVNGIDRDYPPFAYIDPLTRKPAGFDVESMDWIAKTMGFEVSHVPVPLDNIISALRREQIDMICSGLSITAERAKIIDFSHPYWEVDRVFVTRADNPLTPSNMSAANIVLGVKWGTSESEAILREHRQGIRSFELRHYESFDIIIEEVVAGRIDAGYIDEPPADAAIAKGVPIVKTPGQGGPDRIAVGVRDDDTELLNLVNEGYRRLMADPKWEELQRKHFTTRQGGQGASEGK